MVEDKDVEIRHIIVVPNDVLSPGSSIAEVEKEFLDSREFSSFFVYSLVTALVENARQDPESRIGQSQFLGSNGEVSTWIRPRRRPRTLS